MKEGEEAQPFTPLHNPLRQLPETQSVTLRVKGGKDFPGGKCVYIICTRMRERIRGGLPAVEEGL